MSKQRAVKSRVLVGAAGVVATLGLGGTAYAATTTAPSARTTHPAKTKHHPRTLLGRADTATVEVKMHGAWVTLEYDRGKVAAVSATSITLNRPDGKSVTEQIGSSTKFFGVSSAGAISLGKNARVISENGTALRVTQHASATAPVTTTT